MMRVISSSTRALAAAEQSPIPVVCSSATRPVARAVRRNSLLQRSQRRQIASTSVGSLQTVRSSISVQAAATEPLYDIYIKGAPVEGLVNEKGELGDCPFSQRTMMTMQEKNIPYRMMFIDEYHMQEIPWLAEVTEGACKIPFVQEKETGTWYHDSDFIVPYLEDKFPERKLGKPDECPQVGGELFKPAFFEYLVADGAEEKPKLDRLLKEFQGLDDWLGEKGSSYFGGEDVCATDLALAPRVKHIFVGGKAVKGFELPASFKNVHAWMERIQQRKSWGPAMPDESWMVKGWHKKREMLLADK